MADSGIYSLVIKLDKEQTIDVGRLGKQKFKKGFYIYTGSALNGLDARIARHKRKTKKLFWHIDYMLASKHAKISKVFTIETNKRLECKFNRIISSSPYVETLVDGFGCSDCGCKTHLVYFGGNPSGKV